MKVFMLEVGGSPVLAVEAVDRQEAHAALVEPGSALDLRTFENSAGPLWDGVAPLTVRTASPLEIASFLEGRVWAEANRTKQPDERWAVFTTSLTRRGGRR
jgi:hypothetical protein